MSMKRKVARGIAGVALCGISMGAVAQQFPTKPMRWICPIAAGGGADLTTRLIAQHVSEQVGQQIVVDNRTGASGNIGTEIAVRAPADGYTLVTITASFPANHATMSKNPYDLTGDLAYVSQISAQPYILLVHASIPATTVKEFVALARKQAKPYVYGSSGIATLQHMAGVMLGLNTGAQVTHVPYKGGAPALQDLIGGRLQFFFGVILSSMPHIKSGKVNALAVTSSTRSPSFPELPTMIEAGVPGFIVDNWYAAAVPAKTPPAIVARLNAEIVRAVRNPAVEQRLRTDGSMAVGNTAQEMTSVVRGDLARWQKIVKEAGIKPDS
jgi:tripartite-type tricarboxylate transporter receptor subunit TctC